MNKQSTKRAIFTFLLVSASSLAVSSHTLAQEVPFYWNYINVDLDVQTNGDILVTESQEYNFTADYKNQRYRYIPLDKVDEISNVTVQENGKIIPSETGTKSNQFLMIKWQHQLKAPEAHTFTLKYRVIGGLQVKDRSTQIYWKAIFGNRQAPVKKANVRVHLPEVLAGKVTDFQNFGANATSRQVNPQTFEFIASKSIEPQQELEVQVTFPSENLNLPLSEWQKNKSQGSNSDAWLWGFLLLLGGFLFYAILSCIDGIGGGTNSSNSNSINSYYGDCGGGGGGGGDGGGGGGGGDGGGGGGGG